MASRKKAVVRLRYLPRDKHGSFGKASQSPWGACWHSAGQLFCHRPHEAPRTSTSEAADVSLQQPDLSPAAL